MADVFISYSRKDKEFVQELCAHLEKDALDVWVDWEDIPPTAEWLAEIYTAIESADTFVFVLTPDSAASAMCGRELAHAVELHKRLVPLVAGDVAEADVPEPLRKLQWLFFRPGDERARAAEALIQTVHMDLDWVRMHTRLLTRAIEWDNHGRANSFVLRGEDLRQAEVWLAQGGEHEPSPTKQQTEYILASRQAATRQQRTTLAAVSVALVVSIALGLLALLQRNDAVTATGVALAEANSRATAEAIAVSEANFRATAEANALSEANTRATAEAIAVHERDIAVSRQLAAQAQNHLNDQLDLALLLGAQAYKRVDTFEARSSLLKAMAISPALVGLLSGHTGTVSSVEFSPDGTILASAGDDKSVRLWDVATHQALGQLLHPDWVLSLAFSPDGKTLATGGNDGMVRFWEVATRQPSGQALRLPVADRPSSVAFSPDGKVLASGGADLRLWDTATRQALGNLGGQPTGMTKIVFSPDGALIATASRGATVTGGVLGGSVQLWDVASQQRLGDPLEGHSSTVSGVAFSPDGALLVSSGEDGMVLFRDVASRRTLGKLSVGNTPRDLGSVLGVVFSPDGKTLAAAVSDSTVRVWEVASREPLGEPLRGHSGSVRAVAFSPDSQTLASVGDDKSVRLWNVATRQFLGKPLSGHTKSVLGLAFSPDGTTFASGSYDGGVRFWDVATRQSLGEPASRDVAGVDAVAFSADGEVLSSATSGETVRLWDVASRQPLPEPFVATRAPAAGRANGSSNVEFSPDGKTVAFGGNGKPVGLWDFASRLLLGELPDPGTRYVDNLAFSPDGTLLATSVNQGPGNGTVQLWDVASRRSVGELNAGPADSVLSVTFSPDGRTLASGSANNTVRLWDVATRQPLGESLGGHTDLVRTVAFSPDGKMLASGSFDRTVRLWDVATGQPLGEPLIGQTSGVWSVAFSPDSKVLASGGGDGTIMLWDIDPDSWVRRVCRTVNRNMSRVEWRQAMGAGVPYLQTCPDLPLPE